jgi:hypothetical protein
MDYKTILATVAMALTLLNYIPYYYGIFRGTLHPHGFSWFVWSMLTATNCAAQVWGGGGLGSWPMALTALGDLSIVILSLRYGEKNITRSDWLTFFVGLSAIPLWLVNDSPYYSVVILTFADAIGTWPSLRKSWHRPHSESTLFFTVSSLKHLLIIFALDHYNWVTGFYSTALLLTNMLFVAYILWRRQVVKIG